MNVNGTLFFLAERGAPITELWRSDGTAAGTMLVKDRVAGSTVTNVNGTLFFQSENAGTGWELWKSDGMAAGTMLVKDVAPGPANSVTSIIPMMNVNGTLFFGADGGGTGYELWKSDGTATGTVLVKDILPGGQSSYPEAVANVNGTFYFKINDGESYPLWKSDGTEVGTVFVEDVAIGRSETVRIGDTQFLNFTTGATGDELWKSDGTSGVPVLVSDIRPGVGGSGPRFLTDVNGTLFFKADDGTHGSELWKTDGTSAGTVLVTDNPGHTDPMNLTNVNGTLFFVGGWGSSNRDTLWVSDGTAAGTILLKDGAGFRPSHLTSFDGMLYFTAYDGQLWQSDGTSAGTVLAYDVRPGSENSGQERLIEVGSNLFFTANDGVHGQELWVLNANVSLLSIAASNASQAEGNSGSKAFTFTASRTETSGAASVDLVVTGSGANPANGADFGGSLPSGTISFAEGESTKTITINVNGDSTVEPDEGFTVTLSNPSGVLLDTSSATGTIIGDDSLLTIAATSASKPEGHSDSTPFTFTVTRTGTNGNASLDFAVTGNATNPADAADFGGSLPSGTISFAAGETTKSITINVSGDSTLESSENFTVALSNVVGASLTASSAAGIILDDDRPVLRVGVDPSGNLSLVENGNGGSDNITVTLDASTNEYVISSPVADSLTTDDITPTNMVRIAVSQVTGGLIADLGGGNDQIDLSAFPAAMLPITVYAGTGNDTLIGSAGNDMLDGGDGDDSLSAENGNDSLLGGAGSDMLFGGGGIDLLDGGEGNDVLHGQGGIDTLTGSAGNDTLDGGGSGKDVLREMANINFTLTNTQLVGLGTDKLQGLECAQLTSGDGDNTLDATAFTGSVTLIGGNGKDTLIGGAGHDLLKGDSLPGVGGQDYLVGNSGRDTLLGGWNNDTLIGGSGNDLIEGEEDNDAIRGGGGNDTLRGGTGLDTLSETTGGSLILTNNSLNGLGVDVLEQIEAMVLIGNANANRLDASAVTVPILLKGGGGDDTLIGGSSRDQLLGGDGNDLIFGNDNHDTLYGGNGDDSLSGGVGNDFLFGEAGADVLVGDAGKDTLQGGDSSDTLAGGSGTGADAGDVLNSDPDDLIDEVTPFTADWLDRL